MFKPGDKVLYYRQDKDLYDQSSLQLNTVCTVTFITSDAPWDLISVEECNAFKYDSVCFVAFDKPTNLEKLIYNIKQKPKRRK